MNIANLPAGRLSFKHVLAFHNYRIIWLFDGVQYLKIE